MELGLAPSKAKAQALVLAGEVVVDDRRLDKPGTAVARDSQVRLKAGAVLRYVSRGGLKLEAALEHFALDPRGLVCADLGASTGGFSDCLLQRGAARVHACDVGHGLLDPRVAKDPRVVVHDRFNARQITVAALGEPVDLCTLDLSFISLRLVLPAARALLLPGGALLALVKPQFEVGPEGVGKGGVVRDPVLRRASIEAIVSLAERVGLRSHGWLDSPVHGPAGNVEALLLATLERST